MSVENIYQNEIEKNMDIDIEKDIETEIKTETEKETSRYIMKYFLENKIDLLHSKATDILELIKKMCFNMNDNIIILDYKYFKFITTKLGIKLDKSLMDIIIQFIVGVANSVLENYPLYCLHINLHGLSVIDIEKYSVFIQKFSMAMKSTFQDKLETCYLYNSPFIFSNMFKLISHFIDKVTMQKMVLIKN